MTGAAQVGEEIDFVDLRPARCCRASGDQGSSHLLDSSLLRAAYPDRWPPDANSRTRILRSLLGLSGGRVGMYLRTVRGETRSPSLSRDRLAIRSSAQSALSVVILRMSARSSNGIDGRPHKRKPSSWHHHDRRSNLVLRAARSRQYQVLRGFGKDNLNVSTTQVRPRLVSK